MTLSWNVRPMRVAAKSDLPPILENKEQNYPVNFRRLRMMNYAIGQRMDRRLPYISWKLPIWVSRNQISFRR